jgi:rRNA-processing protein FCF1
MLLLCAIFILFPGSGDANIPLKSILPTMPFKRITNVLFDTSFLLKDSLDIDEIIRILRKDRISCYISSTVQTEIHDLYYFGQISIIQLNRAMARYRKAGAGKIERVRNYLEESVTKECTISMNIEHGVVAKDVRNDCSILTSSLNNHIDLILSEDFHFTSKYSDNVVNTVCQKTCDRFHRLCECDLLALNKDTFIAAYKGNMVDLDVVEKMKYGVRKSGKRIG